MSLWPNSSMQTFYPDEQSSVEDQCEVRLEPGRIAVTYEYEGGRITYSGAEIEPGHFEVASSTGTGRGSLHKFKNSKRLEGFWLEDGYYGMWAITLANDDD